MPSTPQLQAVEEQTPLSPASELAQESGSMRNASGAERAPLKPSSGGGKRPAPEGGSPALLAFCFVGLQVSYLTWGYVQEKVMTTEYGDSGRFPSATFCVFSNRVLAILVSLCMMVYRHGSASVPAPLWVFAPCSISNSLSSYGQYQSLRYVSFPLQTLSKSTKVIPVMIMGKLLNKKAYPWIDYAEALVISLGVSLFSFSESKHKHGGGHTETIGV
jgi:adenosine 3'-phospho 5'-phosphosulfate transporter B2